MKHATEKMEPRKVPAARKTSMVCRTCGSEKDIVGGDGRILILDCGCRVLATRTAAK